MTARHGEPKRFLNEAMAYTGDDCLLWPYARGRDGYGHIRYGGRPCRVNIVVCEKTHGPPPTSEHEAAHSCGNGHKGCITPAHLGWKTHQENMADKNLHGTSNRGERNGRARLTREQVIEIRSLCRTTAQREIAERFRVKESTVYNILSGRNWGWLG